MQNIEIKIGNFTLQLESDNAKELLSLANSINGKIDGVRSNYGGLTDIKALLLTMLLMQEEFDRLQSDDLKTSFYTLLESIAEKIEDLTGAMKCGSSS